MFRAIFIIFLLFLINIFLILGILTKKSISLTNRLNKIFALNYNLLNDQLEEKFLNDISIKSNMRSQIEEGVNNLNIISSASSNGSLYQDDESLFLKIGENVIDGIRFITLKNRSKQIDEQLLYKNFFSAIYFITINQCPKSEFHLQNIIDLTYKQTDYIDDYVFANLHMGYCKFLTSDYEMATNYLTNVHKFKPGSSFSDNARIIENLIIKAIQVQDNKEGISRTIDEIVKLYFVNGNYRKVTKIDRKKLSSQSKFLVARSYEKIGDSATAIEIFVDLAADKTTDPEIAKESNRKLGVMSKLYLKNSELDTFVERNARKWDDSEFVESLDKQVSKLSLDSNTKIQEVVKEAEILREEAREKEPVSESLSESGIENQNSYEELRENKEDPTDKQIEKKMSEVLGKVTSINQKTAVDVQVSRKMIIALRDGRIFVSEAKLRIQNHTVYYDHPSGLPVQISTESISKIEGVGETKLKFKSRNGLISIAKTAIFNNNADTNFGEKTKSFQLNDISEISFHF